MTSSLLITYCDGRAARARTRLAARPVLMPCTVNSKQQGNIVLMDCRDLVDSLRFVAVFIEWAKKPEGWSRSFRGPGSRRSGQEVAGRVGKPEVGPGSRRAGPEAVGRAGGTTSHQAVPVFALSLAFHSLPLVLPGPSQSVFAFQVAQKRLLGVFEIKMCGV